MYFCFDVNPTQFIFTRIHFDLKYFIALQPIDDVIVLLKRLKFVLISISRIPPLNEFCYVAKSFQTLQNHIKSSIFHYSKNNHSDFAIFEMILIKRKTHLVEEFAKIL